MWCGLNILLMILANVFIWGFDNITAGFICIGGQILCLIFSLME